MKQWTVYFRDKNGSKASVVIEAEDRFGVFAELKKRGISAISVAEGVSDKKPRKAPSSGAPFKGRGLIAAALLVLVGGVAAWWMWPEENKVEDIKKEAKKQIKATPVQPVKVKEEPKTESKVEESKRLSDNGSSIPDLVQKDERGIYRWPNGARWVDPNRKVVKFERKSRLSTLFKHPCDRHIAAILESEPGQQFFGTVMYSKNLKEDFYESLKTPYEFHKDTSPEDRALQIAVADAKRELKKRLDKGEDLVQILTEARNELERLGAYRNDIETIVSEHVRDDKVSEKDLADVVAAANKMLEKEGLPPVKVPSLVMRQVILNREKQKAMKQNGGSDE